MLALSIQIFTLIFKNKLLPLNIILTGANGYIGQRLIPVLIEQEHHLYCCVRDKERFEDEHNHPNIKTIEIVYVLREIYPARSSEKYERIHTFILPSYIHTF